MIPVEERIHHFIKLRERMSGTINAMMGLKIISYDISKKEILFNMKVESWQINPGNMLHGGILATACDMAMGCGAYAFSDGSYTPTISMSINYLASGKVGSMLELRVQIPHNGRTISHTRVEVYEKDTQKCICEAIGSFAIQRKRD